MSLVDPKNVDIVAAILVVPLLQKLAFVEPGNFDRERQIIVDNYSAIRELLLRENPARRVQAE